MLTFDPEDPNQKQFPNCFQQTNWSLEKRLKKKTLTFLHYRLVYKNFIFITI